MQKNGLKNIANKAQVVTHNIKQLGFSGLRAFCSIVGIDNFNKNLPTLLLYDSSAIEYLGDSINTHGDILLIYGRILTLDKEELFKIGFDLKFDGTKFPWIIE